MVPGKPLSAGRPPFSVCLTGEAPSPACRGPISRPPHMTGTRRVLSAESVPVGEPASARGGGRGSRAHALGSGGLGKPSPNPVGAEQLLCPRPPPAWPWRARPGSSEQPCVLQTAVLGRQRAGSASREKPAMLGPRELRRASVPVPGRRLAWPPEPRLHCRWPGGRAVAVSAAAPGAGGGCTGN